jgi:hypothetical protein
MMLSYNDFEKYIKLIIKYNEKDDQISRIMEVEGFIMYSSELIEGIIDLLGEIMDDKENGWIDYWCWECDFGEKADDRVSDEDGNPIPLKTIKDLYFILLKGREVD